jgi:hypothetical protein
LTIKDESIAKEMSELMFGARLDASLIAVRPQLTDELSLVWPGG